MFLSAILAAVAVTSCQKDVNEVLATGAPRTATPELTNTTTYNTGYFAPLTFGVGNCNYTWVGWGVDNLFAKPGFTLGTAAQRLVSEGRYCCGFSFVLNGYKEGSYTVGPVQFRASPFFLSGVFF